MVFEVSWNPSGHFARKYHGRVDITCLALSSVELPRWFRVRVFFGSVISQANALLGTIGFHWLQQGFLVHATKATWSCTISQLSLPSNVLLEIIEFHWFYKGLPITVRFCSWCQGPDLLCIGSAYGILQIPKGFQWFLQKSLQIPKGLLYLFAKSLQVP